ncbi:MAG: hypothetical protein P8Y10_13245 [Gemmatimonadales bacterium]|jgi:hypothetical protein
MEKFLKLPRGKLAALADSQRKEELKRQLEDEPTRIRCGNRKEGAYLMRTFPQKYAYSAEIGPGLDMC